MHSHVHLPANKDYALFEYRHRLLEANWNDNDDTQVGYPELKPVKVVLLHEQSWGMTVSSAAGKFLIALIIKGNRIPTGD